MRKLIPLLFVLTLTACGFQLRSAQPLPFSSLYIADTWELGAILRRNIRAYGSTQLASSPQEAQAVFTLLGEAREKNILSLSGTGRVREYQLRYRIAFKVHDLKGREYVAPTGTDAEISARFFGTKGGACFRNVNGSFYDFVAERHLPNRTRMTLSKPPDDWGGRAILAWARQLATAPEFDPGIEHLITVAEVLDTVYRSSA